jgi:hypothetical protein
MKQKQNETEHLLSTEANRNKKLIFSERAAFDRRLFDLSNFYQNKINKLLKNK